MLGSLLYRRLEMAVAKAAATAFEEDDLLAVFGDFKENFFGFCVFGDGSEGYIHVDIFSACAAAPSALTGVSAGSDDVLAVLQVKKGPVLRVSAEDDVAATAAVSAIRPTQGNVFFPTKMPGACSACA